MMNNVLNRKILLYKVIKNPNKMSFDPEYAEMQSHYHRSAQEMPVSFFLRHNKDLRIMIICGAFATLVVLTAIVLQLIFNWYYGI